MQRRWFAVFTLLSVSGIYPFAQTPAAASTDTPFEMPGVFRISLPPGWSQSKVIDDRHALAVFSNQQLTLEVIYDTASVPAEQYAQTVTERRMRPEADDYPGKYAPPEVRANPGDFVAQITHRFDEYTLIGGLPAQWARYHWHYSHPQKEGQPAQADDSSIHDAIVWSVFTLSPREYWSLELRGDEKASWSDDLRRMIRSFQLLDPMLSRAKAATPKEAWERMPSNLASGTCQFVGVDSGMGALLPCDMDVTAQVSNAPPQNAAKSALVGFEQLTGTSMPFVSFQHVVGGQSEKEFLQTAEKKLSDELNAETVEGDTKYKTHCAWHWTTKTADDAMVEEGLGYYDGLGRPCVVSEKTASEKLSYHQDSSQQVMVDGYPGTLIAGRATAKKTKTTVTDRLLTVSTATDHFLMNLDFNPSNCSDCPADQIVSSIRLYALRPKIEALPDETDTVCKGLIDAMTNELEKELGMDELFGVISAEGNTKPSQTPPPKPADPDANQKCIELMAAAAKRDGEDARYLNTSDSHMKLGNADRMGKEPDAALSEFKTAVHLNPRNQNANLGIAELYATRGDITNAIAAYERILYYDADADKDELTHGQLASLYAQAGNNVLAAHNLGMAGSNAPQNIMPDADLDAANKQLDDLGAQLEKANQNYEASATQENALADADLGLAVGDFPGADGICRDVYAKDAKNVRALSCLAVTSYLRGEGAPAIDYAQQWLALAPNDPIAYYSLARGYSCDPADYKKAAENYVQVVQHANKQTQPSILREAQVWWPESYESGGMWVEAAKAHDAAASLFPTDAQVLNSTAWFYATTTSNMKNPAKALTYAKRAVAAAPSDPNIIDTLAESYFVSGRVDDAISTEQKALALSPQREDLQKQLEKFKAGKRPAKK